MDGEGQDPPEHNGEPYGGPIIAGRSPKKVEGWVWVANGTRAIEEVFAPPAPLVKTAPLMWPSIPTDEATVERAIESIRAEAWDLDTQDRTTVGDDEVGDEVASPVPTTTSPASSSPHHQASAAEVRVLGPIEVVGWREKPERAIVTELACFLALHGDRPISGDELRTALWPDDAKEASAKSLRTYMSLLRKAFGTDRVPQGTAAGYRLAPDVLVDWVRFTELTQSGCSEQDLLAALGLIRGRPFAGAPSHSFGWIYSELLVSEMEVAIVRAAGHLADTQVEREDLGGAARAIDQGLLAVPSDIGLWEYRLLIAKRRGPDDFNRACRDAEAVLGEDAQPLVQGAS